jgi:alpha 1,2-mannosyltransferase
MYLPPSDEPFTEKFVREISLATTSEVRFGLVPKEHWGYPEWISEEKAAETRKKAHYVYGDSESYRHMCRFQSGFFFRHPLTLDLDYYWRVEPGIEVRCNVDYDPFAFMALNNKTYGFTIAAHEFGETVKTLYKTTKAFLALHPDYVHKRAGMHFLTNRPNVGNIQNSNWNLCHFWSNFEIADLRFWRSKEYMEYFEYLDHQGGFFYERWGDAPVHSIAAALFLDKAALHHFDDIGYNHGNWDHCPQNNAYHHGRCDCNPRTSFDYDNYSCLKQWWKGADEKEPAVYVVPKKRRIVNPLL